MPSTQYKPTSGASKQNLRSPSLSLAKLATCYPLRWPTIPTSTHLRHLLRQRLVHTLQLARAIVCLMWMHGRRHLVLLLPIELLLALLRGIELWRLLLLRVELRWRLLLRIKLRLVLACPCKVTRLLPRREFLRFWLERMLLLLLLLLWELMQYALPRERLRLAIPLSLVGLSNRSRMGSSVGWTSWTCYAVAAVEGCVSRYG